MRASRLMCVGLVCSAAQAAPIVFAPAAPYAWVSEVDTVFGPIAPHALDITLPETQSGATITPTSVYQQYNSPSTSSMPVLLAFRSGGGVQYALEHVANFGYWDIPLQGSPTSYDAPRAYAAGSAVSASAVWADMVTVAWTNGFGSFRRGYSVFTDLGHFEARSVPADFVAGLKLTIAGQTHYGWMHVMWVADGDRGRFDVAQWAYESLANTPIRVPCAADFNFDGATDLFDYLDFVDAFASGLVSADFNHDAAVDFFDYLDFVASFSQGC